MYPISLVSVLVYLKLFHNVCILILIHLFIDSFASQMYMKEDQALLVDVIFYISFLFYIHHSSIHMCEISKMFMHSKSKLSSACIKPSDFLLYASMFL